MVPLNGHGGLASGVVKLEFHGNKLEVSALGGFDWRFHGARGRVLVVGALGLRDDLPFCNRKSCSEAVNSAGRR